MIAAALLAATVFASLGIWQLQRLQWKRALIERVQHHASGAAVTVPGPAEWSRVDAEHDEYLHVRAVGVFLNEQETLVQAVTERGAGFWLMTPLRTDTGYTVLVNRGFVPAGRAAQAARRRGQIDGPTTVSGLLRLSEPGGAFLRANSPAADRWYSRDVSAIAQRRGLAAAAPYFIDADATPNSGGLPVGGLTVIAFRNQHLQYALTWFGLALLSIWYGAVAFYR
jgi:surfeit locus 1 family protein